MINAQRDVAKLRNDLTTINKAGAGRKFLVAMSRLFNRSRKAKLPTGKSARKDMGIGSSVQSFKIKKPERGSLRIMGNKRLKSAGVDNLRKSYSEQKDLTDLKEIKQKLSTENSLEELRDVLYPKFHAIDGHGTWEKNKFIRNLIDELESKFTTLFRNAHKKKTNKLDNINSMLKVKFGGIEQGNPANRKDYIPPEKLPALKVRFTTDKYGDRYYTCPKCKYHGGTEIDAPAVYCRGCGRKVIDTGNTAMKLDDINNMSKGLAERLARISRARRAVQVGKKPARHLTRRLVHATSAYSNPTSVAIRNADGLLNDMKKGMFGRTIVGMSGKAAKKVPLMSRRGIVGRLGIYGGSKITRPERIASKKLGRGISNSIKEYRTAMAGKSLDSQFNDMNKATVYPQYSGRQFRGPDISSRPAITGGAYQTRRAVGRLGEVRTTAAKKAKMMGRLKTAGAIGAGAAAIGGGALLARHLLRRHQAKKAARLAANATPAAGVMGTKLRSGGMGRGLMRGRGKGPIGIPYYAKQDIAQGMMGCLANMQKKLNRMGK